MGTPYFDERGPSVHYGRRVGRGHGRGQHTHEVGKGFNVRDDGWIGRGSSRRCRKVECVIRRGREKTRRSFVAFLGKQLV